MATVEATVDRRPLEYLQNRLRMIVAPLAGGASIGVRSAAASAGWLIPE